jgi:hypothetical protein
MKTLKVLGWAGYAIAALIITSFSLASNLWFGFAVALAFIFGPKVWKRL